MRPSSHDPNIPAIRRGARRKIMGAVCGLAALTGALMAPGAFAQSGSLPQPLTPFEASYEVSNGSLTAGTATFSLTRDAGLWRYRTILKARGLFAMFVETPMRETTWLQAHEGTLRPMIYSHQEGDERRRVVFDWAGGRAQVHDDGDAHPIELEPDSRDQLSAILAVMVALASGERSVSFPGITDDGDAEELLFEATGEESVDAPFGTYDAVRVERHHGKDRTTVSWLAPGLDWLPVRVEQRKEGDLIARLELSTLSREDSQ